ncbi:hypothetical protein ACFQGT_00015 [Natrialbaceae archaeon GCM10025810]
MRCEYIAPSGGRVCDRGATHRLHITDDARHIRFAALYCEAHALAMIDEYADDPGREVSSMDEYWLADV